MKISFEMGFSPEVTEEEIEQYRHDEIERALQARKVMKQLADQFAEIEKQDKPVDIIIMNCQTYRTFRHFSSVGFDVNTDGKTLRETQHMGNLWGAKVYLDNTIEDNQIVLIHESTDKKEEE